jgi:hypothetical protein
MTSYLRGILVFAVVLYSITSFGQQTGAPPPQSETDALFKAVKANDEAAVKRLLSKGLSVNSKKDHATVLTHAVKNKNLALVKWLVEAGAEVNAQAIFFADDGNQMKGYDQKLRDISAYLVLTKASRLGFDLPKSDNASLVNLLGQLRMAISDYLKNRWPGISGTKQVIVRIDDLWPANPPKDKFYAMCDVAVVDKDGMWELISKTGIMNDMPEQLERQYPPLSHAWLYHLETGPIVDTKYNKARVHHGNFLISRDTKGALVASYVE